MSTENKKDPGFNGQIDPEAEEAPKFNLDNLLNKEHQDYLYDLYKYYLHQLPDDMDADIRKKEAWYKVIQEEIERGAWDQRTPILKELENKVRMENDINDSEKSLDRLQMGQALKSLFENYEEVSLERLVQQIAEFQGRLDSLEHEKIPKLKSILNEIDQEISKVDEHVPYTELANWRNELEKMNQEIRVIEKEIDGAGKKKVNETKPGQEGDFEDRKRRHLNLETVHEYLKAQGLSDEEIKEHPEFKQALLAESEVVKEDMKTEVNKLIEALRQQDTPENIDALCKDLASKTGLSAEQIKEIYESQQKELEAMMEQNARRLSKGKKFFKLLQAVGGVGLVGATIATGGTVPLLGYLSMGMVSGRVADSMHGLLTGRKKRTEEMGKLLIELSNARGELYNDTVDNLAAMIAMKKQEQIDEIREDREEIAESPEQFLDQAEAAYLKVVEDKKKDKEFNRENEDAFKEYEAKLQAYRESITDKTFEFLKQKYPEADEGKLLDHAICVAALAERDEYNKLHSKELEIRRGGILKRAGLAIDKGRKKIASAPLIGKHTILGQLATGVAMPVARIASRSFEFIKATGASKWVDRLGGAVIGWTIGRHVGEAAVGGAQYLAKSGGLSEVTAKDLYMINKIKESAVGSGAVKEHFDTRPNVDQFFKGRLPKQLRSKIETGSKELTKAEAELEARARHQLTDKKWCVKHPIEAAKLREELDRRDQVMESRQTAMVVMDKVEAETKEKFASENQKYAERLKRVGKAHERKNREAALVWKNKQAGWGTARTVAAIGGTVVGAWLGVQLMESLRDGIKEKSTAVPPGDGEPGTIPDPEAIEPSPDVITPPVDKPEVIFDDNAWNTIEKNMIEQAKIKDSVEYAIVARALEDKGVDLDSFADQQAWEDYLDKLDLDKLTTDNRIELGTTALDKYKDILRDAFKAGNSEYLKNIDPAELKRLGLNDLTKLDLDELTKEQIRAIDWLKLIEDKENVSVVNQAIDINDTIEAKAHIASHSDALEKLQKSRMLKLEDWEENADAMAEEYEKWSTANPNGSMDEFKDHLDNMAQVAPVEAVVGDAGLEQVSEAINKSTSVEGLITDINKLDIVKDIDKAEVSILIQEKLHSLGYSPDLTVGPDHITFDDNMDVVSIKAELGGIQVDFGADNVLNPDKFTRIHESALELKNFISNHPSYGLKIDNLSIDASDGLINGVNIDLPNTDKAISLSFVSGDSGLEFSQTSINHDHIPAGIVKITQDLLEHNLDADSTNYSLRELGDELVRQQTSYDNIKVMETRINAGDDIHKQVDLLNDYINKNPDAAYYVENKEVAASLAEYHNDKKYIFEYLEKEDKIIGSVINEASGDDISTSEVVEENVASPEQTDKTEVINQETGNKLTETFEIKGRLSSEGVARSKEILDKVLDGIENKEITDVNQFLGKMEESLGYKLSATETQRWTQIFEKNFELITDGAPQESIMSQEAVKLEMNMQVLKEELIRANAGEINSSIKVQADAIAGSPELLQNYDALIPGLNEADIKSGLAELSKGNFMENYSQIVGDEKKLKLILQILEVKAKSSSGLSSAEAALFDRLSI